MRVTFQPGGAVHSTTGIQITESGVIIKFADREPLFIQMPPAELAAFAGQHWSIDDLTIHLPAAKGWIN